jgi:hypothetical protein
MKYMYPNDESTEDLFRIPLPKPNGEHKIRSNNAPRVTMTDPSYLLQEQNYLKLLAAWESKWMKLWGKES